MTGSGFDREDKRRIWRGLVRRRDAWVTLDESVQSHRALEEKLRDGYVRFQGEWIPIDEKIRRTLETRTPEAGTTIIHNTVNRQVYNSHHHDNRNYSHNVEEHRHVHVHNPTEPAEGPAELSRGSSDVRLRPDEEPRKIQDSGADAQRLLPGRRRDNRLPPRGD